MGLLHRAVQHPHAVHTDHSPGDGRFPSGAGLPQAAIDESIIAALLHDRRIKSPRLWA